MRMDALFILGFQRSGTTMLRLMLNAHRDIAIPHETAFATELDRLPFSTGEIDRTQSTEVLDLISNYPFIKSGDLLTPSGIEKASQAGTVPDMIRALFEGFARSKGARIWGDKSPNQTFEIARLAKMFPDARFIHLVRDGRACMLSHKHIDWGTKSPPALAGAWSLASMVAEEAGRALGIRFHSLRYEDLVRDPATKLHAICRFLGIEFDENMLDYSSNATTAIPSGSLRYHASATKPPDASGIDRWRRNLIPAEISLFEEHAAAALDHFGYGLVNPKLGLKGKLQKLRLTMKHRGTPVWLRPPPYNLPLPNTRPGN